MTRPMCARTRRLTMALVRRVSVCRNSNMPAAAAAAAAAAVAAAAAASAASAASAAAEELLVLFFFASILTQTDRLLAGSALIAGHASFKWDDTTSVPVLSGINFKASGGELAAVVGSVGAGKSTLISALLGELTKLRGACQSFPLLFFNNFAI